MEYYEDYGAVYNFKPVKLLVGKRYVIFYEALLDGNRQNAQGAYKSIAK